MRFAGLRWLAHISHDGEPDLQDIGYRVVVVVVVVVVIVVVVVVVVVSSK